MPGGPPPTRPSKTIRGGSAQDLRRKGAPSPAINAGLKKRASSGSLMSSTGGVEASAIARVAAFAAAGRASLSPHSMSVLTRQSDDERSVLHTQQSMNGAGFFWRTTMAATRPPLVRSARGSGSEDARPKSSMLSARPDLSTIELPARARSAMGGLAGLQHQGVASLQTVEPAAPAPDYMYDDYENSDDGSSVEVKPKRKSYKKKDPYEKTLKEMEDYAQKMEDATTMLENRLQMHIPPNLQEALAGHRQRGAEAALSNAVETSGKVSGRKSAQDKFAAAERLDEKLATFLDNHKRMTSMPRMAVRIQKWWRMTKRWRNYRRFRKSVKIFKQRSLVFCVKGWRLAALADVCFRANLLVKILEGWRVLARNSMIWDEESALIFLECTRLGGIPQRALFLEVNDKNTFRRAGMEHNFGKGYKHGIPLPTREHVLVVQCLRRTMIRMAKLRLRRWAKWVMWKKDQSNQGMKKLEMVYQHRREEKFVLKYLMWSRFTILRKCLRLKEEVPEFEFNAFWDDWYRQFERKQQLSSDHVLKLQWRFLTRNTIIRWTRFQSMEQTKRYVHDKTVAYYVRKAKRESFAEWLDLAKLARSIRYRYHVILANLSHYAAKKAGQRTATSKVVEFWRARIKRSTIVELRRVAHYMLVIHAGGLHRIRQDHSRALWAALAWLSWRKRDPAAESSAARALFDGSTLMDANRLPGGLCSLGVCDGHFHFADSFRLWVARARRRRAMRSLVLSLYYEEHIAGSLRPRFRHWRQAARKEAEEPETRSKEELQRAWLEFWAGTERVALMANRGRRATGRGRKHYPLANVLDSENLWPRLVTQTVKRVRRGLEREELQQKLQTMTKRERIEHRQQELSTELGATGMSTISRIPTIRAFANQERQRQPLLCMERLAGLKRDYKLLLAGEVHDLVAAYSGVYDTQYRFEKKKVPFTAQHSRGEQLFSRTGRRGSWFEETQMPSAVDLGRGRRSSILGAARDVPRDGGEVLGGLWFAGTEGEGEGAGTGGRQRRASFAESVAEVAEEPEGAKKSKEEEEAAAAEAAKNEEEAEAQKIVQSMWEYEEKMDEDAAEQTVQQRVERSLQLALSDMYGKMLAAATTQMPIGRREREGLPADPYFEEDYILRTEAMAEDYAWLRDDTLGSPNTQPLLKTPEELLEERRQREAEAKAEASADQATVSPVQSAEVDSMEAGMVEAMFFGIDLRMDLAAESPSMLRAGSDGVPRSRPISAFSEDKPLLEGWRREVQEASRMKRPPPRRKAAGKAHLYSEVLAAYAKKKEKHGEELAEQLQRTDSASATSASVDDAGLALSRVPSADSSPRQGAGETSSDETASRPESSTRAPGDEGGAVDYSRPSTATAPMPGQSAVPHVSVRRTPSAAAGDAKGRRSRRGSLARDTTTDGASRLPSQPASRTASVDEGQGLDFGKSDANAERSRAGARAAGEEGSGGQSGAPSRTESDESGHRIERMAHIKMPARMPRGGGQDVHQAMLEAQQRSSLIQTRRMSEELSLRAEELSLGPSSSEVEAEASTSEHGGAADEAARRESMVSVDEEETEEGMEALQRSYSATAGELLQSVGSWTQQLGAGRAGGRRHTRSRPGSSVPAPAVTISKAEDEEEEEDVEVVQDEVEQQVERLEEEQEQQDEEELAVEDDDSEDGEDESAAMMLPSLRVEKIESRPSSRRSRPASGSADPASSDAMSYGDASMSEVQSRPATAMDAATASEGGSEVTEAAHGPWEEMLDAHAWVKEESREIKEALRGGMDSLYWRSKVTAKRSKRQQAAQMAIDREYELGRQRQEARMAQLYQLIGVADMSALQAVLPEHWQQQQPEPMQTLDPPLPRKLSSAQASQRPLFQSAAPAAPHPLAGRARGNQAAKARKLALPLAPVRPQQSDSDLEEREFVKIATSTGVYHSKVTMPSPSQHSLSAPSMQPSWPSPAAIPHGRSLADWMVVSPSQKYDPTAESSGVPPVPFSPPFHTRQPLKTEDKDDVLTSLGARRQADRTLTSSVGLRVSKGRIATSSVAVRFPSASSAFVAGGARATRPAGGWTADGERPGTSGSQSARSRTRLGKLAVVRHARPKTERSDRSMGDLLVAGGRFAQEIAAEESAATQYSEGGSGAGDHEGHGAAAAEQGGEREQEQQASGAERSEEEDGGSGKGVEGELEAQPSISVEVKPTEVERDPSAGTVGTEPEEAEEKVEEDQEDDVEESAEQSRAEKEKEEQEQEQEQEQAKEEDDAFPIPEEQEPRPVELRDHRVEKVDDNTLWRPWAHRSGAEILNELYADGGDEHVEARKKESHQAASGSEAGSVAGSDADSASSRSKNPRRLSSAAMIVNDGIDESDLSLLDPELLNLDYTPTAEVMRGLRLSAARSSSPKRGNLSPGSRSAESGGGTSPARTDPLQGGSASGSSRQSSRPSTAASQPRSPPNREGSPTLDAPAEAALREMGVISEQSSKLEGAAGEREGQALLPAAEEGAREGIDAAAVVESAAGHGASEEAKGSSTEAGATAQVAGEERRTEADGQRNEKDAMEQVAPEALMEESAKGTTPGGATPIGRPPLGAMARQTSELKGVGVAGQGLQAAGGRGGGSRASSPLPVRGGPHGEVDPEKEARRQRLLEEDRARWVGVAVQHRGERPDAEGVGAYLSVQAIGGQPPRPQGARQIRSGSLSEAPSRKAAASPGARARARALSLEPDARPSTSASGPEAVANSSVVAQDLLQPVIPPFHGAPSELQDQPEADGAQADAAQAKGASSKDETGNDSEAKARDEADVDKGTNADANREQEGNDNKLAPQDAKEVEAPAAESREEAQRGRGRAAGDAQVSRRDEESAPGELRRDDSIQQLGALLAEAGRARTSTPSPEPGRRGDQHADEFSAYVNRLQDSDTADQFDRRGRRAGSFRASDDPRARSTSPLRPGSRPLVESEVVVESEKEAAVAGEVEGGVSGEAPSEGVDGGGDKKREAADEGGKGVGQQEQGEGRDSGGAEDQGGHSPGHGSTEQGTGGEGGGEESEGGRQGRRDSAGKGRVGGKAEEGRAEEGRAEVAGEEAGPGRAGGAEESPREWGAIDSSFEGMQQAASPQLEANETGSVVPEVPAGLGSSSAVSEEADASSFPTNLSIRNPARGFGGGGARRKKVELDLFKGLRERRAQEQAAQQREREAGGGGGDLDKPWRRVVVRRRPPQERKRKELLDKPRRQEEEAAEAAGGFGNEERRRAALADLNDSSSSAASAESEVPRVGEDGESGGVGQEEARPEGEETGAEEGGEGGGEQEGGGSTEEGGGGEGDPGEQKGEDGEGEGGEGEENGDEETPEMKEFAKIKAAAEEAAAKAAEEEARFAASGGGDRYARFFRPIKRVVVEDEGDEDDDEEQREEEEKPLSYTSWEQSPWLSLTHGVDRHFEAMQIKKINKSAAARRKSEEDSSEEEDDGEAAAVKHTLFTGRSIITPEGVYDSVLARIRAKSEAVDRRALQRNAAPPSVDSAGSGLLIDDIPVPEHPRPGEVLSPLTKQDPLEEPERFGNAHRERPGARKRFF